MNLWPKQQQQGNWISQVVAVVVVAVQFSNKFDLMLSMLLQQAANEVKYLVSRELLRIFLQSFLLFSPFVFSSFFFLWKKRKKQIESNDIIFLWLLHSLRHGRSTSSNWTQKSYLLLFILLLLLLQLLSSFQYNLPDAVPPPQSNADKMALVFVVAFLFATIFIHSNYDEWHGRSSNSVWLPLTRWLLCTIDASTSAIAIPSGCVANEDIVEPVVPYTADFSGFCFSSPWDYFFLLFYYFALVFGRPFFWICFLDGLFYFSSSSSISCCCLLLFCWHGNRNKCQLLRKIKNISSSCCQYH